MDLHEIYHAVQLCQILTHMLSYDIRLQVPGNSLRLLKAQGLTIQIECVCGLCLRSQMYHTRSRVQECALAGPHADRDLLLHCTTTGREIRLPVDEYA